LDLIESNSYRGFPVDVHRHKKNLKDYTKPQGLICKTAIIHLLPQAGHGWWTGRNWLSAAPATQATRSTDEARNQKRGTRGPRGRAHPRRTAMDSTGYGGGSAGAGRRRRRRSRASWAAAAAQEQGGG
jgi:hypothetical protein